MSRKMHPDGVCECCGKAGPTVADVESDDPIALCDRCNYARQRWNAWQSCQRNPSLHYPYADPPPKTPPVRR